MKKAKEIIEILNAVDENVKLEAKRGSSIDKSVMESICAFSNEPNLGGGLIVLGIQREENSLFPSYIISGINNTDQLQADIASQCASIFNFPIRPIIEVETVEDKNIIKIQVEELVPEKKPLFFKNLGIPKGIFRRIGSTDQHCSEEDLSVFYGSNAENYDTTIISGSSIEDISDEAVDLYRKHIKKVKPNAEELEFDNLELLYALNAISAPQNDAQLTLTGLLVFGKRMSLRRLLPMFRVDYIRVAGKEWVENPDERFESTIDMRGALLELLPRTIAAIADDLPKGFYLPEGSLQSNTETGLPYKVLREAIVNALIHRSYKVNSPIQIIRYSNRIEIINAGYSLKSLEAIGEPGSFSRNPHIAAIFHDTNLAETKGTGIKSMRKHLKKSQLLPPTFESSHTANSFTLRLLLHHLINEKDHLWLSYFEKYKLNDEQKTALIFLREVGAIDNQAYRQLTGVNLLQSNLDLRKLVSQNFLEQKGNSKKLTYYVPGKLFLESLNIYQSQDVSVKPETLLVESETLLVESETLLVESETLLVELPETLQQKIRDLGSRSKPEIMEKIILEICNVKAYNLDELSKIVNRRPHHIREKFLNLLMKQGKIEYTIPEVINHPKQAYKTITNEELMEKVKLNRHFISDIFFYQEGPGVRKWQFKDSGVKLINVGNINNGKIDLSSTKINISEEEAYGKYSHFLIDEGDLLIACSGIVVENFHNKIAFIKKEHLPLCLNTSTMRFKELPEKKGDLNFLKYFLQTNDFKSQLRKLITGSAQLNFGPSHIRKIEIPLPNLATQQRIAAILDQADAIIQNNRAIVQKYDALTQSLFLDMFGDPVKNEKGWEKVKGSLIYQVKGRVGWKGYKKTDLRESGAYVIGATHIDKFGYINLTNPVYISDEKFLESPEIIIEKNDLIFVQRGNTIGKIGLVRDVLERATINPVVVILRPKVSPYFLLYLLLNKSILNKIIEINSGSAQPMITQNSMNEYQFINPPLELQNQFAERVAMIEAQKQQAQLELAKSEELFKSLLQRAFKGELN